MMENKMTNQERLEEYLVGTNGYLKRDISNGKVIMLSGKWGSGKTHFWQNKIQTVLNENDKKIPNHYISLYGKTSIQEIKNEVFLKIFESVDSFELEEKGTKLVKNTVDLISLFTKSVGIDLSKIIDKPFENFQKMLDDKKLKKTQVYLNSGAVICFDDFERKSKDIDLNDLFGFITQLTLNFSCKVVIILNDDVFEGEEKNVFSRVKEKSVSKFLKYEPDIKDLFETIFISDERYRELDEYKEIILKTIEETQELNARIYIQVLDNLVEWIGKNQEISEIEIEWLILITVNFILNHKVFTKDENDNVKVKGEEYLDSNLLSKIKIKAGYEKDVDLISDTLYKLEDESLKVILENNRDIFKSKYFIKLRFGSYFLINNKTFKKINNFIESGILINE